jgi:catechol 2,3-dioxygenase-like lactoylglutathione lyase family enzyme
MDNLNPISLDAVVLDCRNPDGLADFYIRMLGWHKNYVEPDEWVDIEAPGGGVKIAFQRNDLYEPPVWPEEPGKPQQMAHLDFAVKTVEDMDAAVNHALSCGASEAAEQYGGDKWHTLIDPEGHPFCFVIW